VATLFAHGVASRDDGEYPAVLSIGGDSTVAATPVERSSLLPLLEAKPAETARRSQREAGLVAPQIDVHHHV